MSMDVNTCDSDKLGELTAKLSPEDIAVVIKGAVPSDKLYSIIWHLNHAARLYPISTLSVEEIIEDIKEGNENAQVDEAKIQEACEYVWELDWSDTHSDSKQQVFDRLKEMDEKSRIAAVRAPPRATIPILWRA